MSTVGRVGCYPISERCGIDATAVSGRVFLDRHPEVRAFASLEE